MNRAEVGVTVMEFGTNLYTAPTTQRVAILIVYCGIGSIYVGYTVLML